MSVITRFFRAPPERHTEAIADPPLSLWEGHAPRRYARREVITPRTLTDHLLRDNLAFPVFHPHLRGYQVLHRVV
jgi:hypothetical protein